jgi:hypothetical protein
MGDCFHTNIVATMTFLNAISHLLIKHSMHILLLLGKTLIGFSLPNFIDPFMRSCH